MSKDDNAADKQDWYNFCKRSNPKATREATDRLYEQLMRGKRERKRRKVEKVS